jgi:AraC family transcriptional regulator
VIAALNKLVELVEDHLTEDVDIARLAATAGVTEYHLRRMFSSLAGIPLSEYVRRRRMSVAAGDVLHGGDLMDIAVRFGYGSSDAFARAFRATHGVSPSEARRNGGPLRTQQQLRFRLTVEGTTAMDTRIADQPAFRLIGHSAVVPLIHEGVNPHIQAHVVSISEAEHIRLKALSNFEPAGLLAVCADVDPDYTEGTNLTYLHGVAVNAATPTPLGLDFIDVPAGAWAVFRSEGPYPAVLQSTWAATATDWFPSDPWQLRPGPSIVTILDRAQDFTTATCELWLPVERA